MKTLLLVAASGLLTGASTLVWCTGARAQSNESVPSTVVNNILLGNYTPATYQATTVITDPNTISAGLLQNISTDSLSADLFAMNSFQNRNTFSDTTSTTTGI